MRLNHRQPFAAIITTIIALLMMHTIALVKARDATLAMVELAGSKTFPFQGHAMQFTASS